jgi:hypothetical protein
MVDDPFLSFYTPTYRRPMLLAACLESVRQQTVPCEQLVVPDHVGLGIAGMYARVARYAGALHGRYVHFLADDDQLAAPDVVARVADFAQAHGDPPVIIVQAIKNGLRLPLTLEGPPREGAIDLGCLITRRDIWTQHADCYGRRYEGDYDFARSLWDDGHPFTYAPILFETGPALKGAGEAMAISGTWP